MNKNTRTKNALLNIAFGYIAQIGIFILSFIGRKIFLLFLSADYLGINGLYSNILTILSLAELGLDSAVVYSLYKPVAEENVPLIASLINYFKKVYRILAGIIFLCGILLIPILKYLINSDLPDKDLIAYYVLFLINTVASYFVAHKVALLSACQEQRLQKIVTLSANLLLQILHIIVLFVWKNYFVYIFATVCSTILSNVILSKVCGKAHPELFKEIKQVKFEKGPIKRRIISTFLYKIGAVAVNSTDNILISVLVSTVAVGYYSNYYTVVSALQGFVSVISVSMISGIGNLAAKEKKESQTELFDMMLLFYHFLAALGLVGFSLLFNDLIEIWLGKQYLFSWPIVFVIAFNFYITNAVSPVWMFREANGFFDKVKYLILIRAVINLILSVALGKRFGVLGIFIATAVSMIMTNFWREPEIVSKDIFNRKQSIYWLKQLKYFVATVFAFFTSNLIIKQMGHSFIQLMVKALIVCIITFLSFVAVSLKSKEQKN